MGALDAANATFWNEPCGSDAARLLGITDASRPSLERYDAWFFTRYPYLADHIPFATLRGKQVLEVGLGYGSVAQRLAENGACYTGLDIAAGPVRLVRHRLRQNELPGCAVEGNILRPPFARDFDCVVAIGCLHHTGDLRAAIAACHDLLVPGGQLIFMVYNNRSYKRRRNDANAAGDAAPFTEFASKRSLRAMCRQFASVHTTLENIADPAAYLRGLPSRDTLMRLGVHRLLGVDIYATAIK